MVSIINKYKYKNFDIEIDGITNFKNKEFEVVKLGVKNNDILQSFHDELSKLPNSNEFPDYIPHITISYVNLGSSDKYVNKDFKINNIKLNQIEYSKPNGVKLNFDLY